ncbi:hypothetical protein PsorP6_007922 [Peronosclerospora sorghi]|uniref:Uncharacterized protein n=1 Tax=Peronosclerospora sorghi TaxID=230839 RepID=A0ACC0W9R3_9STRA|nr:hypothetical protein PsorP6_007922 [Peronosclerospora sorghi]
MTSSVDLPAPFLSLEADFVENKMAINNAINAILRGGTNAVAEASQLAQAHVVEAQRSMKLMTVEVRGRQPNLRKAMQTKINLYREELNGLIRDLERAQLLAREGKATVNATSQVNRSENVVWCCRVHCSSFLHDSRRSMSG